MKNRTQIVVSLVLVLAAAAVVGVRLESGTPSTAEQEMEGHDHAAMMAAAEGPSPVRMAAEDRRRIGVTFGTVERRALDSSVEALGTVAYDERGLSAVSPRIQGWVEELFADVTGAPIRRGQPLMAVYSPELVSAQEELVLAARLAAEAGEGRTADNARALLESARRRLAYWDVPAEEIDRIEASGEVRRTLTLRAPATGVVVEKNVIEGERITPGATLYRIADLSTVWIEADVFERDLGRVREGLAATATFEALPGRSFPARVTYVYPTVSMESRTGRVRLELANPRGELKPGMYARVTLDVPAAGPQLVVPRGAVLQTGTRTLVFVRAADGTLVPREVMAGRTEGSYTEVLQGLSEGERVVASAAFLVDAESSLGALTEGMTEDGMDGDAMDHSGHDMAAPADTMDHGTMDHSGHDMGTPPDTTMDHSTMDHGAMDHSGHDMGTPPDTTTDHGAMDHSGHGTGSPPDTTAGAAIRR